MNVDDQMQGLALKLLQKERSALDNDEIAILEKFANRTPVSRDLSDDALHETIGTALLTALLLLAVLGRSFSDFLASF